MSRAAAVALSGTNQSSAAWTSPAQVKILAAAQTLIQTKGGADVTMAEIAKAAGLSRQAIYLHFEDRESLLLSLARFAADRRGLDSEVQLILESSSGVLAMTRYVELLTRTNPGIWVLARAADAVRRTDQAVENTWQNRVQVRLKVCEAIIARIHKEGALAPGVEPETAVDLLWTLTSLRTWEDLVQARGWASDKFSRYICGILTRTLIRL